MVEEYSSEALLSPSSPTTTSTERYLRRRSKSLQRVGSQLQPYDPNLLSGCLILFEVHPWEEIYYNTRSKICLWTDNETASTGCFKLFITMDEFVKHIIRDHVFKITHKLLFCGWMNCLISKTPFSCKNDLILHALQHVGLDMHMCSFPNCRQVFVSRYYLWLHHRRHNMETPRKE